MNIITSVCICYDCNYSALMQAYIALKFNETKLYWLQMLCWINCFDTTRDVQLAFRNYHVTSNKYYIVRFLYLSHRLYYLVISIKYFNIGLYEFVNYFFYISFGV